MLVSIEGLLQDLSDGSLQAPDKEVAWHSHVHTRKNSNKRTLFPMGPPDFFGDALELSGGA